ncbi:MAG: glycosyltransferase family 4 protein [Flavobacteriaceae bacterium]
MTTVPLSLEKLLEGQLGFMKNHFDVIAVSSDKNRLALYAKNEGVRHYSVNLTRKITPLRDIAVLIKMYRFFRKEKPQIVHTHTPKAGIVGMMAAWFARVPIRLHTVAGLPLMETQGLKKKLLVIIEKLTYRFANKVYPNSYGLKDYIVENKFCSAKKLCVLGKGSSNGIDVKYFSMEGYNTLFQKEFKEKMGILKDDFVFIFVGRIVKDKGIVEFIDAFTSIQSTTISLLLVGPFEEDLDPLPLATLQTIKTHSKIVHVGYQQDVRPFFAISNALVFPSYREGFPNVVLQALAMGLPAIVSDINGCNEIITNNVNGLIIPKKDTHALANAMQVFLGDSKTYQDLAKNTRNSIVENYERSKYWSHLLAEYEALLFQN